MIHNAARVTCRHAAAYRVRGAALLMSDFVEKLIQNTRIFFLKGRFRRIFYREASRKVLISTFRFFDSQRKHLFLVNATQLSAYYKLLLFGCHSVPFNKKKEEKVASHWNSHDQKKSLSNLTLVLLYLWELSWKFKLHFKAIQRQSVSKI